MSTQQDFTQCPHWGKGGRYIVDGNGQRMLVPPVDESVTDQPTPLAEDGAGTTEPAQSVRKGK